MILVKFFFFWGEVFFQHVKFFGFTSRAKFFFDRVEIDFFLLVLRRVDINLHSDNILFADDIVYK